MNTLGNKVILSLLGGLILLPFGYLLLLSLSQSWDYPQVWPDLIGTNHWQQFLHSDQGLMGSLALSTGLSLMVASIATLLGFASSKAIAYHPFRRGWLLLAYFPFVLSPVIFAAILFYYFVKIDLAGSIPGVMLAQLLIAYPYAVILFTGFWNERLQAYDQLASTLGGNGIQRFTRVLIPLAKGMLLVCFFQTFLISWFEYGLTALIGVGKIQTLTIKVFQYINEANVYYAALASCLLILPPAVLLWVNKRFVFNTLGQ